MFLSSISTETLILFVCAKAYELRQTESTLSLAKADWQSEPLEKSIANIALTNQQKKVQTNSLDTNLSFFKQV